jgi:uncharacterized membrane protein YGL010W
MKTLIDHLSTYATYHRHVRNIATHFVGIPVIVVSVAGLLARASVEVGGLPLSLAIVAWLLMSAFYLRLDARYGLSMTVLVGLAVWAGHGLAALPMASWLGASLGLFVVGWVIQFVGHYYEGRKPAFVDDIMGLAVGPLFVVAEAGFLVGLRPEVQQQVEQIAGPVRATPAGQVQTSH